jgi:hypothetical protein
VASEEGDGRVNWSRLATVLAQVSDAFADALSRLALAPTSYGAAHRNFSYLA